MSQGYGNGSWNQGRYGVWSYQDCEASTTAVSAFTASATVVKNGQVLISASSVATSAGQRIHQGAATASASSSTSAGAVVVFSASATISGSSTASASAQRVAEGSAQATASSTTSAACVIVANAAARLREG
jgi:uridylate kinase